MRVWMKQSMIAAVLFFAFGMYGGHAADLYLELGPIKGDSRAPGHEDSIVVDSFSYSSVIPPAERGETGRSSAAGKPVSNPFVFTKKIDSSSPLILQFLWNGATLAGDTVLSVADGGGEGARNMKFTLNNVAIVGYSITGDGDVPRETVTLSFSKIRVEYKKGDKAMDASYEIPKDKR